MAVNDSEEIENFYEDLLGFKLKNRFLIEADISWKFFKVKKDVDVYFMRKGDLDLEIFLSVENRKKQFMHICMDYSNAKIIWYNAQKRGYKTKLKVNHSRDETYFIWDKSGNMFELKDGKE